MCKYKRHQPANGPSASSSKKISPMQDRHHVQRPVALGLLITLLILNLGMCIAGAFVAGFWNYGGLTPWRSATAAKLSTMYIVTPAVLTIVNTVELTALCQGFLYPTAIVVTASTGIVAWTIQLGLDGACVWDLSAFYNGDSFIDVPGKPYCPWYWTPPAAGGFFGLQSWGMTTAQIMPWLIIVPLACYIPYLTMGGIWLARAQKATNQPKSLEDGDDYEKISMSPRDDQESASSPLTATRDSNSFKPMKQIMEETSPTPSMRKVRVSMVGSTSFTTAPPSYTSRETMSNDFAFEGDKKASL